MPTSIVRANSKRLLDECFGYSLYTSDYFVGAAFKLWTFD